MIIKKGFSVLFALGFLSVLAIIATTYISSALYLNSLAQARQNTEYQYWATRGLLEMGKAQIKQSIPEQPIHISSWPAHSPYSGQIQFVSSSDSILIIAQLMRGKQVAQRLSYRQAVSG